MHLDPQLVISWIWFDMAAKARKYSKKAKSDDEEKLGTVAALSTRMDRATAIAEECGLGPGFVNALKMRMERKHVQTSEAIRSVTHKEKLMMLNDRMFRALEYLDDTVLAQAPARDLAYVVEMLNRNIKLEMGQPTQILSIQERRNINDLIPAVLEEARRRGMTIDVDPIHIQDSIDVTEDGDTCPIPSKATTDLPELV